jgi:hypothetical protein
MHHASKDLRAVGSTRVCGDGRRRFVRTEQARLLTAFVQAGGKRTSSGGKFTREQSRAHAWFDCLD